MGNGTLDDSGRGNAAPLLVPDNQTGTTGGRQGRGGREQGRGGEGRERGESEKRAVRAESVRAEPTTCAQSYPKLSQGRAPTHRQDRREPAPNTQPTPKMRVAHTQEAAAGWRAQWLGRSPIAALDKYDHLVRGRPPRPELLTLSTRGTRVGRGGHPAII